MDTAFLAQQLGLSYEQFDEAMDVIAAEVERRLPPPAPVKAPKAAPAPDPVPEGASS